MIRVEKYTNSHREAWNKLVKESKNGTFLYERDFIEYHAHRFTDHSLLFYYKENLVAVMPANAEPTLLATHRGLTWGGIISTDKMTTVLMMELVQALVQYMQTSGFKKLYYKAAPAIFHKYPSSEDLYALYRAGAQLVRREVSSVIDIAQPQLLAHRNVRNLKKNEKEVIRLEHTDNYADFMKIVETLLQEKYKTKPTHTLQEIQYLKAKFPDHIHLLQAYAADELLGGVIYYVMGQTIHTQYIAFTDSGKNKGAMSVVVKELLERYTSSQGYRYLSFGISTENEGKVLNDNLITSKENLGGRAIVHDFYELTV